MIDIKEIKKTCPKAYEALRKWIETQVGELQQVLSKDESKDSMFKVDQLPPIDDVMIEGMLSWNQRQLFDFFDDNEIYINISWADLWNWSINLEESFYGITRIDCEKEAFSEAFKYFENQLNKLWKK